jgi:ribosome-associated toxin RatA of RatAB toxin-antitoxin module
MTGHSLNNFPGREALAAPIFGRRPFPIHRLVFLLGCALLLAPAPGLTAGEGIEPDTDFRKIFNNSTIISSNVFSTQEANALWITMFADTHVTTDIPLAKLRRIITDYENYPKYFKRNTSSRIAAVTGEGVYQDVRVTVGLIGFSFSGRYTVLVRELINQPDKFWLTFTHVTDDGNIRNVHGEWYFETLDGEGSPRTYVRYVSSSQSIRRFFLQKTIQSMFVGSEFTDMTDQLLEAAAKY